MNSLYGIQLETTTICQGKCVFCPRDKLTEHGSMTDALYAKIVQEAVRLPALAIFNIQGNAGEPLCDPQFMERLEFARKAMPKVSLEFYTNGTLLTEPLIDRMALMNNLRVNVSLNGGPETRKRLMGLDDYWRVVRMLRYMREKGISNRASMVYYPEITRKEVDDFVDAGGFAIQYQSWAGKQYPYERRRWTSCQRAMNHMYIRFNGQATLCCFDMFGTVPLGDLNTQTIQEVWQGECHKEYVLKHKAGKGQELALCESCTEG